MTPDEQMAVREQISGSLLHPPGTPGRFLTRPAGPAARLLGDLGLPLFTHPGQGVQDRSGDLLEYVELADLVEHAGEDLRQRLRIQG